ncbi:hypothetical protein CHLNCDRAFT_135914 [Chlorella variabilis]|uniref:mRNA export factor GLE1 n=1 Tax=Chlorella variabilis TaxID=554065 RepID=E1ZJC7_CHLVA|nr:hypothetical protein CHLNCDRAFT_135914 [Chlorella variabilis]EFN53838.1 hypothetical protein CHLNCDRAFT_135914 [Chlorella variabilis]|eukprot:XP_005845940.1 hypothetical protein CHLNCDRAFT_135914 [Chlorella variabilis]
MNAYRSPGPVLAMQQSLASPTSSTGGSSRGAHHAGQTPIDSLPLLASTSRLRRSASNASSAAGAAGSPAAAGARGGAANLPPTASSPQHQLLTTPSFGRTASNSSGSRGRAFAAPLSPGFGGSGPLSGIRPRFGAAAPASGGGGGCAALDRRFGGSSRRLSAPTGYSESGMSEAAAPSFSLQAPSGLSSDDEEEEVDSGAAAAAGRRRRLSAPAGVRPLTAAELALAEVTARLEAQLRVGAQKKVAAFERALLDIEADEAAELAAAASQCAAAAAAAAKAEADAQQARQRQRAALLSGLRSQHQQKAEEGERKVQQLEAAVRQQQEAAAAAAKARAEQQAAMQAAAQAEAVQRQQAAAQQAAAEAATAEAAAAAAAQRSAAAAAAAARGSGVRIAPSAAEWEKQCAAALAEAQAAVRPFVDDRSMRDKKRAVDKFVTLNVQQISATLEQVRLKAQALAGFVGAQHGAQRIYALLTLANKLVSQCEVQVTRLHAFAFPLAEVAVAVMAAHPDFVPLLAARLHQLCPLTVPKYAVFRSGSGQDEDAYLRQLGYMISADEDTGQVTRETTDEFVGRVQGYLMLYAAVTQSDNPQNPHGLGHAWTLLARLLTALPANRVTATAVDAVLKVAGYRMHLAYRGQFMKLLQYIDREFLPALGTSNDPDARAVHTRISTYLRTAQYSKPPEGRDMPQFDASSYDRA